jgi:hypothetical protein
VAGEPPGRPRRSHRCGLSLLRNPRPLPSPWPSGSVESRSFSPCGRRWPPKADG